MIMSGFNTKSSLFSILAMLESFEVGSGDKVSIPRCLSRLEKVLDHRPDEHEIAEKIREKLPEPKAGKLRVESLLQFLSHHEHRHLADYLELFLSDSNGANFRSLQTLISCAKRVRDASSFPVTRHSHPLLHGLMVKLDARDGALRRLELMRSHIAGMIRHDAEHFAPFAIWETLIQISVLYGAARGLSPGSGPLQPGVIKFARGSLPGFSFQQVMRLCQSVHGLEYEFPGMLEPMLQEVEDDLDESQRSNLIRALVKMQSEAAPSGEATRRLLRLVFEAAGLNSEEQFFVHFLQKKRDDEIEDVEGTIFDLPRSGIDMKVEGGTLQPCDAGKDSLVNISEGEGGKARVQAAGGERLLSDGDELWLRGQRFVFRPSASSFATHGKGIHELHAEKVCCEFGGNKILTDVSVHAKAGEMLAVVGPSGCGKSTLLTLLSGLLPSSGGIIRFNGRKLTTAEDFSKVCTYIPQDEILYRELTVTEAIQSSAALKVKAERGELRQRLDSTLSVLGLEKQAGVKIGTEDEKGISGGQRKRVNIGTTIVADMKPILLFDEPTSGLDPATDAEIMRLLRNLAAQGHIVLVVTHNLSMESMGCFDRILVLGTNGHTAFYGKLRRLCHFFAIDSSQVLFQKMRDSGEDFHARYKKTPEFKAMEDESKKAEQREDPTPIDEKTERAQLPRPGATSNLCSFLAREIKRKSRDKQFLAMCLFQPLAIALFINWIFAGPLPNALFAIVTASLWIGSISGVREFNGEWAQIKRDAQYGTSLIAFHLAKLLVTFGFAAAQIVLLVLVIALGSGYAGPPFDISLPVFFASQLALALCGVSIGLLLSAAIRSPMAAIGLLPVILIPLVILGGALVRHSEMQGFKWQVMRFNPLRVAFEASVFSSNRLLSPRLADLDTRNEDEAAKQAKDWTNYLERKRLHETDPKAYDQKYGKKDLNSMFAGFLNEEPEEKEVPPPSKPTGVTNPELLIHRPDLWLIGYSLIQTDRPEGGIPPVLSAIAWKKFELRPPVSLTGKIGTQSAMGSYVQEEDKYFSVYSPAEPFALLLLEAFLLHLVTGLTLQARLRSRAGK